MSFSNKAPVIWDSITLSGNDGIILHQVADFGDCKTKAFAPVSQEASIILPEEVVRNRCEPLSDQNDFSESSRLQDLFVSAGGSASGSSLPTIGPRVHIGEHLKNEVHTLPAGGFQYPFPVVRVGVIEDVTCALTLHRLQAFLSTGRTQDSQTPPLAPTDCRRCHSSTGAVNQNSFAGSTFCADTTRDMQSRRESKCHLVQQMSGAVAMARLFKDPADRQRVLASARDYLLASF
jgi:hypothetical protein